MPAISRRANELGTENAFVVLAEVSALQRQGKDIISFCIGQPDFPTPKNIREAGIKAINEGKHGYTPSAGILELREAAANYLNRTRHINIHADDVVVGARFSDLRITNQGDGRGAGADLPARVAQLQFRSRRA